MSIKFLGIQTASFDFGNYLTSKVEIVELRIGPFLLKMKILPHE